MKEPNGRILKSDLLSAGSPHPASAEEAVRRTAAYPREFLHNKYVYLVVSPRARGLSIGVNMNPDKKCQFDCVYCEVDRVPSDNPSSLDVSAMARELEQTVEYVRTGRLRELHAFRRVPEELLKLRHVALSGDGEPTLCPVFAEALQAVLHVRARNSSDFFKLVLITNGVGLNLPPVMEALGHLTRSDEVWIKLDGGTQAYLNKINGVEVPLTTILDNILLIGRRRPVTIQSLFPAIHGKEPPAEEIAAFAQHLKVLKESGAQLELVQIYSATRPTPHSECGHLSLKTLSNIAQTVRTLSGVRTEVF